MRKAYARASYKNWGGADTGGAPRPTCRLPPALCDCHSSRARIEPLSERIFASLETNRTRFEARIQHARARWFLREENCITRLTPSQGWRSFCECISVLPAMLHGIPEQTPAREILPGVFVILPASDARAVQTTRYSPPTGMTLSANLTAFIASDMTRV